MSVREWPPPCPSCGETERQKLTWSRDGQEFRQVCYDCGHDTDWGPWPPVAHGYTYEAAARANRVRNTQLRAIADGLRIAAKLATHTPPLRDRLERIAAEVDECAAWSGDGPVILSVRDSHPAGR